MPLNEGMRSNKGGGMFGKLLNALATIAICGFFALFVSAVCFIVLFLLFAVAMIPVSVIAGDDIAHKISGYADDGLTFRIVYAIVFVSMLMEDPMAQKAKNNVKMLWSRAFGQ